MIYRHLLLALIFARLALAKPIELLSSRADDSGACSFITGKCVDRVVAGKTNTGSLWNTRSCVAAASCSGVTAFFQTLAGKGHSADPKSEGALSGDIWTKMAGSCSSCTMTFSQYEQWMIGSLQAYGEYGIGVRDSDALPWWQPIASWTGFCSGDQCADGKVPQSNFNDWLHYSGNAPTTGGGSSGGDDNNGGGGVPVGGGGGGGGTVPPPVPPPTGGGGGSGGGSGGDDDSTGDEEYEEEDKEDECDECDDSCSAKRLSRRARTPLVTSTFDWWDQHALQSGYYFNQTANDAVKLYFNRTAWELQKDSANVTLLSREEPTFNASTNPIIRLSPYKFELDCSQLPEVCENMCYSVICIRQNGWLFYKNSNKSQCNDARRKNKCGKRDTSGIDAKGNVSKYNYCSAHVPGNPSDYNCDEFPFASTKEGQTGSQVATRCVPVSQNSAQGGSIQSAYSHISQGSQFYIILTNTKSTKSFCKGYGGQGTILKPDGPSCTNPTGVSWGDAFGRRTQTHT